VRRRSRRSRLEYPFERAITWDPTVGSPLNFNRTFRKLFSLGYMWNRYSVRRLFHRSRLEYPFERAITWDPTVGSPSNFYRSFTDAVFLVVEKEALLGEA
jgi:hypothetical protein